MQIIEQERRRQGATTRFKPGQSGNPFGRESIAGRERRRDALVAEWTAGIGGLSRLTRAELDLLRCAADLALRRPRRHEEAIKCAGAIARILLQVGLVDGRARERAGEPTLTDVLREGHSLAGSDRARRPRKARGRHG
jgi:hypothetical protein